MVRSNRATRDEAGSEFVEPHVRIALDDLEALAVEFFLELGFNGFGLPPVGSASGLLMPDAVLIEVRPPDIPALEQAHLLCPPCCWLSIQRTT